MSLDVVAEFESLIEALASRGIDHAVCGGFAVNIHGHVRSTRDIDLLVRRESLDAVQAVARDLGFTIAAGPISFGVGTPAERELHRVTKFEGQAFLTLDLLVVTEVFEDVWKDRQAFEWRGHVVHAVSLAGLARMKRLAGRHQDLADLENLGIGEDP